MSTILCVAFAPARDSKAISALTSTGIIAAAAASTPFRVPAGYLKELNNAAQGEVRSRISVKHEHARTGHDSALAGREQCTLLWPKLCRPKRNKSSKYRVYICTSTVYEFFHSKTRNVGGGSGE
jgi:hypothetical protein